MTLDTRCFGRPASEALTKISGFGSRGDDVTDGLNLATKQATEERPAASPTGSEAELPE